MEEATATADAVRAIRAHKFLATWTELCAHADAFWDMMPLFSAADQLSLVERMKQAQARSSCMPDVFPSHFRNDDHVRHVAFAFTQPDWMDVAAHACMLIRTRNHSDDEPNVELSYREHFRRPFMHMVWTHVAYYFWCNNDRVRLRALLEAGILSSVHVVDMLSYASAENKGIIAKTQRAARLLVGGGSDAPAPAPVPTTAQQLFTCVERRALIHDLIVATSLVFMSATPPTSTTCVDVYSNVIHHFNLPMLRFLCTDMHESLWSPSEFIRAWIVQNDPSLQTFRQGFLALTCLPFHSVAPLAFILCTVFEHKSMWKELSFTDIFAPHGILATLAREMQLVEVAKYWFIDNANDEFPAQMNNLGNDMIRYPNYNDIGWEDGLAYTLAYCIMTYIAVLRRDPTAVFDYDFRTWNREQLIARAYFQQGVRDLLARGDFVREEFGGNEDMWAREWTRLSADMRRRRNGGSTASTGTTRRTTCPVALLFNPQWVRDKHATEDTLKAKKRRCC